MFSRKCPNCGESIRETGFKDFFNRMKAFSRNKLYFRCNSCSSKYLLVEGKLVPFSEENLNKVRCSYCGKELDYKTSHKETNNGGVAFSCKDCLKKSIRNWLILIVIVIIGMTIAWQFSCNK